MITQEEWMDLLSYRSMAAAGVSWAEIARLAGCDWRTARKYLSAERPRPPRYRPRPPRAKLIDPYTGTIDAWLRATTIYERLVAEHAFPGSYQRVKEYLANRRPEIAAELGLRSGGEMHRRFAVAPGPRPRSTWAMGGACPTALPSTAAIWS